MSLMYGLALERDKAFSSLCDLAPVSDGGTIKATDVYNGDDGRALYVQLVIPPGEFVQEISLSMPGGGELVLEGYGYVGEVRSASTWSGDVDVSTSPLVIVISTDATGVAYSDDVTVDITPYTSFVDNGGDVITDDYGDAINVVA